MRFGRRSAKSSGLVPESAIGIFVLYGIVLYLSTSIALLTAWAFQKQLTLCRSLHAEALQATVSEGLAQSPCVVARAGFEPTILCSKGIGSTNACSMVQTPKSISFLLWKLKMHKNTPKINGKLPEIQNHPYLLWPTCSNQSHTMTYLLLTNRLPWPIFSNQSDTMTRLFLPIWYHDPLVLTNPIPWPTCLTNRLPPVMYL